MRIADLDDSTRKLIFSAKAMARFPSNKRMRHLKRSADQYDAAHADEQLMNLMSALFGSDSPEAAACRAALRGGEGAGK